MRKVTLGHKEVTSIHVDEKNCLIIQTHGKPLIPIMYPIARTIQETVYFGECDGYCEATRKFYNPYQNDWLSESFINNLVPLEYAVITVLINNEFNVITVRKAIELLPAGYTINYSKLNIENQCRFTISRENEPTWVMDIFTEQNKKPQKSLADYATLLVK